MSSLKLLSITFISRWIALNWRVLLTWKNSYGNRSLKGGLRTRFHPICLDKRFVASVSLTQSQHKITRLFKITTTLQIISSDFIVKNFCTFSFDWMTSLLNDSLRVLITHFYSEYKINKAVVQLTHTYRKQSNNHIRFILYTCRKQSFCNEFFSICTYVERNHYISTDFILNLMK